MLARRFTIVCLIAAIFGMGMAILVAESSRPAHSFSRGALGDCPLTTGYSCAPVYPWQERPVR
jgi:hypothetical protein